jgi:hypothetical protein
MTPEFTPQEYASALDAVAMELLVAAGIVAPPVDAFRLAAGCRLAVALDDGQSGRARFVRLARREAAHERGAIFIRSDPRPERRQWAVAHEVGEAVAERVFQRLGVRPAEAAPAAREEVANGLANRILLPTGWFGQFARRVDWNLLRLKTRFATASHELIARRMLEFDSPAIVSVFDHGRLTWRRANTGRRPPRLAEIETQCWRAAHDTGRPQRRAGEQLDLTCWPIHEPNWKREIMRTRLPEAIDF